MQNKILRLLTRTRYDTENKLNHFVFAYVDSLLFLFPQIKKKFEKKGYKIIMEKDFAAKKINNLSHPISAS